MLLAFASSMNLLLKGRITGFSGIFLGTITLNGFIWKISIINGILWISHLFYAFSSDRSFYDSHLEYLSDLCFGGFCLCGFLVGAGTILANGCKSGHRLCGLARLSPRSIVSVVVFLIFGFGLHN